MPNKPTTLRELEESLLDLLHETIQHTPITISETDGSEYTRGYIHYQDMVVETVREIEPKLKDFLTAYSTELLRKIEELRKLKQTIGGVPSYFTEKDKGYNQAIDDVISFINQEK